MAQRKQHNNSGGQFPLGQILAGVIGGGGANPDYQSALMTKEAGETLTPAQSQALATGPYKPNNAFQKYYGQDTADRGNMAWQAANHEDALALARQKAIDDYRQQLEIKGIPLRAQADIQAGDYKDAALGKDLADASYNWNRNSRPGQPLIPTLSPQEYKLILGSRAQQLGIPQAYQDSMAATYGIPLAGDVETSGQEARIGGNRLATLNSQHAMETENRVHPYNLAASGLKAETGVTNARIGAKQAHGMENRMPHLEATLDTQAQLGDDYAASDYMAQLAHRVNLPVGKDQSVFNVLTGSPAFDNSEYSKYAKMKLDGGATTNSQTPVDYHPVFGPIYRRVAPSPSAGDGGQPRASAGGNFTPAPQAKAPEPQNPLRDYGLVPRLAGSIGMGLKGGIYDPIAESLSGIYSDVLKPAGRYWFTGNPIDQQDEETLKEPALPLPKRGKRVTTIPQLTPALDPGIYAPAY